MKYRVHRCTSLGDEIPQPWRSLGGLRGEKSSVRLLEERKSNVIREESCVASKGDNLVAIEGYREDAYKYCEYDALNHSSMSPKH